MKKLCICLAVMLLMLPIKSLASSGASISSVFQNTDKNGLLIGDTPLGRLAADAVKAQTGARAALVPIGELGANLQPGELTGPALSSSFPGGGGYVKMDVPVSAVFLLLEEAYAHAVTDYEAEALDTELTGSFSGYLIPSAGLHITWDPTAPEYERVYSLELDGERLERDSSDILSLALPAPSVMGGYGYTALDGYTPESFGTLAELVAGYAADMGEISPDSISRTEYIGVRGSELISGIPKAGIVVLILLMLVFSAAGLKYKRKVDFER